MTIYLSGLGRPIMSSINGPPALRHLCPDHICCDRSNNLIRMCFESKQTLGFLGRTFKPRSSSAV